MAATKSSLTPVPVPLARRWREFRIRFLPIIVFVAVAGVVAGLWQEHAAPAHMVGLAVADHYQVRSPRDGFVHELVKDRFDLVDAQEVVASLHSPRVAQIQAQLQVILAEVQLIRAGLDPAVGRQRAQMDYEALRLDKVRIRIQLAADRLERDQLQRERERQEQLYDQNLISLAEYDRTITQLDIQDMRVREGTELLNELEPRLAAIASLWDGSDDPYADSVAAAIWLKEKELGVLEAELAPFELAVPAPGIVAGVLRRNGEYVAAGDTILEVRSQGLGYIVGYLRQPLSRIPESGAEVQVYTKSGKIGFDGVITQVGFQLEPIHEALLRPGMNVEYALPVRIRVAADADILPGEVVDIRL